jgi:hypothetical protein
VSPIHEAYLERCRDQTTRSGAETIQLGMIDPAFGHHAGLGHAHWGIFSLSELDPQLFGFSSVLSARE